MMHIVGMLFTGLIVGAIARMLMPGDQKMGWTLTSLVGVAGSFIAGFAGKALGLYQAGQPAGWIASVVGALVLLVVVGKVQGASSSGGDDQPQA